MRIINLEAWPRRKHFEVYNAFDYPHFNITAHIDITSLYPLVKQRQLSFSVSVVYLLARTANDMPEFRLRIRDSQVVEHDIVHPSPTVLADSGLFSFCTIPYSPYFAGFYPTAMQAIQRVRQTIVLEDEPGQDDLLFMTSMPWVSFTGLMHPIHMHPADSVPRLAWGKFFREGERLKMPLSVQVHHALMDGLHAGIYYERVQAYLDEPEVLLGLQDKQKGIS